MTAVAASGGGVALAPLAQKALQASGAFWLGAAMLGQWAFFFYITAFYGTSALTGDFAVWNRLAAMGVRPFVTGDTGGNLAFLSHALAAGVIAFGGALQLIPQVRARFPTFHRWNGRLFLLTVTGLSLSGFYLVWARHAPTGAFGALSTSFNGVLILSFAALAWRTAVAGKFAIHRRWAMRLYLVSNAQWFLRVGVFAYFVVSLGVGHKVKLSDPFLIFWTVGCYLVPLAILELYLRARDDAGPVRRLAVAGVLFALTLFMGVGILGFAMFSQLIITGAPLALPG